jgi:hypothetical protein
VLGEEVELVAEGRLDHSTSVRALSVVALPVMVRSYRCQPSYSSSYSGEW